MKPRELIRSHRYAEAIADLRQILANNPEDRAAVEGMAKALRANEEYAEAFLFFQRLRAHYNEDKVARVLAPGSPIWQIDIACLRWLMDDHSQAIRLMHGLAAGILDGSIKYSDGAGGMSQGLLLYYMALSEDNTEYLSFALDYLRNRVKQTFDDVWPCPIARYYLGDIALEEVMEAVNDQPTSAMPLDEWRIELGRRRRLTGALFHDAVRSRARGDEAHCLARMRECYNLENPLLEQEWYLARYEVRKADNKC